MRTSIILAAAIALAVPAAARAQNPGQLLQGLMTGNQNQDQAIRDAYERGYQKGRQDEAQLARRGDRRREPDRGDYDQRDNGYRR